MVHRKQQIHEQDKWRKVLRLLPSADSDNLSPQKRGIPELLTETDPSSVLVVPPAGHHISCVVVLAVLVVVVVDVVVVAVWQRPLL